MKAAANPANDGQIIAKSNSSYGSQFKTSRDTGRTPSGSRSPAEPMPLLSAIARPFAH